jgi:hypothetical protein
MEIAGPPADVRGSVRRALGGVPRAQPDAVEAAVVLICEMPTFLTPPCLRRIESGVFFDKLAIVLSFPYLRPRYQSHESV